MVLVPEIYMLDGLVSWWWLFFLVHLIRADRRMDLNPEYRWGEQMMHFRSTNHHRIANCCYNRPLGHPSTWRQPATANIFIYCNFQTNGSFFFLSTVTFLDYINTYRVDSELTKKHRGLVAFGDCSGTIKFFSFDEKKRVSLGIKIKSIPCK